MKTLFALAKFIHFHFYFVYSHRFSALRHIPQTLTMSSSSFGQQVRQQPNKKRKFSPGAAPEEKERKRILRWVEETMKQCNRSHNTLNNKSPFFQQKKRESLIRPLTLIAKRLYTGDECERVCASIRAFPFVLVGPHKQTVDSLEEQRRTILTQLENEHGFLQRFRAHREGMFIPDTSPNVADELKKTRAQLSAVTAEKNQLSAALTNTKSEVLRLQRANNDQLNLLSCMREKHENSLKVHSNAREQQRSNICTLENKLTAAENKLKIAEKKLGTTTESVLKLTRELELRTNALQCTRKGAHVAHQQLQEYKIREDKMKKLFLS